MRAGVSKSLTNSARVTQSPELGWMVQRSLRTRILIRTRLFVRAGLKRAAFSPVLTPAETPISTPAHTGSLIGGGSVDS